MTPGNKTQPFEDIQNVAWNRQVQHILASVFSTRCVIWDLSKNEPIIKLSDSQSCVRWRGIQWHPQVATQLWLASEEDQAPFIQLWDLRYATTPAKTVQIHTRGVLDLSWCKKDNDLMLSCSKDNKIMCWNPNVEVGHKNPSEIASPLQWYSSIDWCPKNPALLGSSSYEGNVSVYSLFGGTQQQLQTSNKIADSFPGMDQFAQAPVPQPSTQIVYSDLKVPPKWMKRTAGASFGFGGKLFTFRNDGTKSITINQIITDPDLVELSVKLEEALAHGNYTDYCRHKADQMKDQHNRYVWYFIKANFDQSPRNEMLNLLGYNAEDMSHKFEPYKEKEDTDVNHLTNQMADLSRSDSSEAEPSTDYYSTDTSGVDNSAIFDALSSKASLQNSVQQQRPFRIGTDDDTEGMICQAILSGNIEAAVQICMDHGRTADGIILAGTGGPELLARTQYKYLKNSKSYLAEIISAMVTNDWNGVVSQCAMESWKEALVATINHSNEQMSVLCEKLGDRLHAESENDLNLRKNAISCYICAGNVSRVVEAWIDMVMGATTKPTTEQLQELIEVVMLLQKAMESQGRPVVASGKLATFLNQYAGLLTAQGALSSALTYLEPSDDPDMEDLRDRLYYALGYKQQQQQQQQQSAPRRTSAAPTYNGYGAQSRQPTQNFFNPTPAPAVSQPPSFFQSGFTTSQPTSMPYSTAGAPPPINNFMTPPTATNNYGAAPSTQNFCTPPTSQSMAAKPPPMGPPPTSSSAGDPMRPPSRPSSAGPQNAGPLGRTKYVRDPSVQSGPAYGQTSNFFNPSGAAAPTGPFNNAPFGGVPPLQTQPQFNQFNTQPFGGPVPQPQMNPTPFSPGAASQAPTTFFTPQANSFNSNNIGFTAPGGGAAPIDASGFGQPPPIIPQKNPTPPPGWNDPPPPKARQQKLSQSQDSTDGNATTATAAPITHPIFGQDPNAGQQQMNNFTSGMPQQQQPSQPPSFMQPNAGGGPTTYGAPMYNQSAPQHQFNMQGIQQQQPFGALPTQQPTQPVAEMMSQQQQPQQMRQPEASPAPKPPLPEEYVYMQTVFNELRSQCMTTTSNPQTKRKLEDVAKRLETLYDLLRMNRLTPSTLESLNQLVQLIQRGDYNNCLALHTQMVSGQDFSQIASFMPGIKVLIQTALQLQVYLS